MYAKRVAGERPFVFKFSINLGRRFFIVSCVIMMIIQAVRLLYPIIIFSQYYRMYLNRTKTLNKEKAGKWHKIMGYLWLFAVILIIASIFRNIRRISLIRTNLEEERKTVSRMEDENKQIQEKIMSMQKIDFLEREARNKLGLVKEGEVVVILPEDSILTKLAPKITVEEESGIDPNWKQWLKLFY